MKKTLIRLDPKQRRQLILRARENGTSLGQEVGHALNLYLAMPIDLEDLAREANRSADRMIRKLDGTLLYVNRILRQLRTSPGKRLEVERKARR